MLWLVRDDIAVFLELVETATSRDIRKEKVGEPLEPSPSLMDQTPVTSECFNKFKAH